jgi:hypothetical protein
MDLENLLGLQRTLCAAVNSEKLGLQPAMSASLRSLRDFCGPGFNAKLDRSFNSKLEGNSK